MANYVVLCLVTKFKLFKLASSLVPSLKISPRRLGSVTVNSEGKVSRANRLSQLHLLHLVSTKLSFSQIIPINKTKAHSECKSLTELPGATQTNLLPSPSYTIPAPVP